jgi:hypothetical protein
MFTRKNIAAIKTTRYFVLTVSAIVLGVAAPMIHTGRTGSGNIPFYHQEKASNESIGLINEWSHLVDESHGKWQSLLFEEEKYVRLCDRVMLSIVTLDYEYMGRLVPALRRSLADQSKRLDEIGEVNSDRESVQARISSEAEKESETGNATALQQISQSASASNNAANQAVSLFRQRLSHEDEMADLLQNFANSSIPQEDFVSEFTRLRRQSAGAASEMEESYKESLRIDAAIDQIDLNGSAALPYP